MIYPDRFYTGIRGTSIFNPAVHCQGLNNPVVYEGHYDDHFPLIEALLGRVLVTKQQAKNAEKINALLSGIGTQLGPIAAASFDAGMNWKDQVEYRTSFVMCSDDGTLMWRKYVANHTQSARNDIYVAGYMFSTMEVIGEWDVKLFKRLVAGELKPYVAKGVASLSNYHKYKNLRAREEADLQKYWAKSGNRFDVSHQAY